MGRRRHTVEHIVGKLREAELAPATGRSPAKANRKPGITEQTYYRWRKEYAACGWTSPGVSTIWRRRTPGSAA